LKFEINPARKVEFKFSQYNGLKRPEKSEKSQITLTINEKNIPFHFSTFTL
jgi:hypothetical protein